MLKTYNTSTYRKFPRTQFRTHLLFFFVRSTIFVLFNTDLFHFVKPSEAVLLIRKNFAFSFLFYIFQFYIIIKSLIIANMYSYSIGLAVSVHNAALTIPVFGILIQTSLKYQDPNLIFNWILTLLVFFSYILEAFLSYNFIVKMNNEKMNDQFFRICVDPKINRIFSIREKLRIFTEIKAFLGFMDIGRYFMTPNENFKRPFVFIMCVILLTVLEQILILIDFNGENILQRCLAIVINVLDNIFIIVTILFLVANVRRVSHIRVVVILITYVDMLIVTLTLGYFLINDVSNFGEGLKEAVEDRKMDLLVL